MPRFKRPRNPVSERQARYEKERHQDEDLDAQRRMAKSAEADVIISAHGNRLLFWALVWAGVSAGISLIAVFTAINSNKTARSAVVLETRPWVSVEFEIYSPLILSDSYMNIRVNKMFQNYGRTPATNVVLLMRLLPHDGPARDLLQNEVDVSCREAESFARGQSTYDDYEFVRPRFNPDVFPGDKPLVLADNAVGLYQEVPNGLGTGEKPVRFSLVGCVRYTSVGDDVFHTTPIAFELLDAGSRCNRSLSSVDWDDSDEMVRQFSLESQYTSEDSLCFKPISGLHVSME
jgi:hypothetical protein